MHNAAKSIIKGLEKDLKQYGHNMDSGKETTEKDAERLKNLSVAMLATKLICFLEEMKEGGEKEGKGGMGGMLHAMGKQMGGGQGNQGMMNAFANAIGLPQIGFTASENHHIGNVPYGNNYDTEMRRGVPGSGRGRRAEMDEMDDMEMRRGRDSRGRYTHRAEMEDNYDMNMAGGQGGNSGGGQGGSSGGNTGRR